MHMPSTSLLCLPSELILIITAFLPRKDQLTFSLVSSRARVHILAPLFHDFLFAKRDQDIKEAHDNLKCAQQDVKDSIRPVFFILDRASLKLTKTLLADV